MRPRHASPHRGSADRVRLVARLPSTRDPGVYRFVFRRGERLLEAGLYPGGRTGVVHLCLSTQWGCRMGCAFCATAALRQSYRGDLGVDVEDWQRMVRTLLRDVAPAGDRALREIGIDWMGMGEPLHNLDALVDFMRAWRPPRRLARARVLYRVNTVGVPAGIDRLAALDVAPARIKLYLSVHAVRDRGRWIPQERRAPLDTVLDHARAFHARRPELPVALTYLVLPGVNDGDAELAALGALLDPAVFYLRLCRLNPVDTCPPGLRVARPRDLQRVARRVRSEVRERHGASPRIDLFRSRGLDVEVGCGQLCGRLRDPA